MDKQDTYDYIANILDICCVAYAQCVPHERRNTGGQRKIIEIEKSEVNIDLGVSPQQGSSCI